QAHAPGVVVGAAEELEFRSVGLETVKAHLELVVLLADLALESGIADDAPEPVVQAPAQVARPGVRVAGAPAAEEHLAYVGLVVAPGGLEEQRVRRLVHDDAAVGEGEAGGDAQLVGEDGELVRPAGALGVFKDDDAVAALTLRLQLVGVVER